MNIVTEKKTRKNLIAKANSLIGCLSDKACYAGQRRYKTDTEDPLHINEYISDKAKILSSKAWRTLGDKTQVFTLPRNRLVRTRDKHVGEVVAISSVVASALGLNTDLVEAAAYGHDIGHVPFGHQGEMWMAQTMGKPDFCHEVMGPIVLQKIERKGRGLNLCHETLNGMMCHSGNFAHLCETQEAWVLRYADKFAYIFHDINDIAIREQYPIGRGIMELVNFFGKNQRERTSMVIAGLIIESAEEGRVSFEKSEIGIKFKMLRDRMYEVYPHVTQQKVGEILEPVLEFLDMLRIGDPFLLLALLTDKDALMISQKQMRDADTFKHTALSEIAPYLQEIGSIDLCEPDLNW
jgi:dGTP triphosphohydrolase